METPAPPSVAATVEDVRSFLEKLKADMPEVFRPRQRAIPPSVPAFVPHPASGHLLPASGVEKDKGVLIPFQGGKITFETGSGQISGVVEVDGGIRLLLSEDESTVPAHFVREWYLRKAWEQFTASAQRWSAAMELKYRNLRIKDQKSLWGSCTRDGDLNFNWRLILAPPPLLDYLVIHELAHLKELNHSKKFWAIVASWCPEYRRHRLWLRQNDKQLRWNPEHIESLSN